MTHHRGMVAAGDLKTAEAAAEILRDGGSAFDAVLAGLAMACISEPVLCSLGGGGFLLAEPSGRSPLLYDFFCQTPGRRPPRDGLEFIETNVDFGTATQSFHHGTGSIATPGIPAGIEAIHHDLCRLPLTRIFEPAISAARNGLALSQLQAFILQAVQPIFLATPSARRLFGSGPDGQSVRQAGEKITMPHLADTFEQFARDGSALFYTGDIAQGLTRFSRDHGGCINADDLASYQVIKRAPHRFRYSGAEISINPAPSLGGRLIAFTLGMLDGQVSGDGSGWTSAIASALELTSTGRHSSGQDNDDPSAALTDLLAQTTLDAYKTRLAKKIGGTTHISVVDSKGNAAAMTLSNGEGAGHVLDGTDIMLNNMLGEEDTNPRGFFEWRPDSRISSMMSPAIVEAGSDWVYALGSGGSNRIRSAIAQTLVNLLARNMSPQDAIDAPRLHFENGLLSLEGGHSEEEQESLADRFQRIQNWGEGNFFFGGVHIAGYNRRTGAFSGGGDPRRGGIAITV